VLGFYIFTPGGQCSSRSLVMLAPARPEDSGRMK
jgi:hypothetical protein